MSVLAERRPPKHPQVVRRRPRSRRRSSATAKSTPRQATATPAARSRDPGCNDGAEGDLSQSEQEGHRPSGATGDPVLGEHLGEPCAGRQLRRAGPRQDRGQDEAEGEFHDGLLRRTTPETCPRTRFRRQSLPRPGQSIRRSCGWSTPPASRRVDAGTRLGRAARCTGREPGAPPMARRELLNAGRQLPAGVGRQVGPAVPDQVIGHEPGSGAATATTGSARAHPVADAARRRRSSRRRRRRIAATSRSSWSGPSEMPGRIGATSTPQGTPARSSAATVSSRRSGLGVLGSVSRHTSRSRHPTDRSTCTRPPFGRLRRARPRRGARAVDFVTIENGLPAAVSAATMPAREPVAALARLVRVGVGAEGHQLAPPAG